MVLMSVERINKKEPSHHNEDITPEGERPCPICGEAMDTKKKRGVAIDVCEEHGVWLDQGEMSKIIERIRKRDALAYEKMIRQARIDGHTSIAILHLLNLLSDE